MTTPMPKNLLSRIKHAAGLNEAAIALASRLYVPAGIHGDKRDYQRFMVLSYKRSGSTMLTSALKKHSRAHCFGEVFNRAHAMAWTEGYDNTNSWLNAIRNHRPEQFLSQFIFRGYAPTVDAVGFKIFPEHAQDARFRATFDELLADPDVKVIHLVRQNKLAMYLSLVQAQRSGVWAVSRGDTAQPSAVTIDPTQCAQGFSALEAEEDFFRERLASRDHFAVSYEQLVQDPDTYFGGIQQHLGLPVEPMQRATGRQRTVPLRDAIANFAELEMHFTGTPAAAYFSDESNRDT